MKRMKINEKTNKIIFSSKKPLEHFIIDIFFFKTQQTKAINFIPRRTVRRGLDTIFGRRRRERVAGSACM
jgi:hypothetical protein